MNDIHAILARKQERKEAADDRRKERSDKGEINHLLIERTPMGLYRCRYEKGPLPEELKGWFTNKSKIYDITNRRGLTVKEAI